eukprot:1504769-Rhodomonas_salina.2
MGCTTSPASLTSPTQLTSPTPLTAASPSGPACTSVTPEPKWSSPAHTQGFDPPFPVLTMAGIPSRGAATTALTLDHTSTGGASRTKPGAPAPRQHPWVPRGHCFDQPVVPRCYRPRLDTGNEQLSHLFRHPSIPPGRACPRSRTGSVRLLGPTRGGSGASRSTRRSSTP